jgi:integrase/recombinase XerC
METPFDHYTTSFALSLHAANKSDKTIETYTEAAGQLFVFVTTIGRTEPDAIIRADVEAYLSHLRDLGRADSTVQNRYRSLRQLFAWLLDEEEIERDPMAAMKPPAISEKLTRVLSGDEITALLKSCNGRTFEDRRDRAIFLLLIDSAVRRAELVGMKLADVHEDRTGTTITVMGKGRRERTPPLGSNASVALNRYLRARDRRVDSGRLELWLGRNGPLTASGVRSLVKRRGEAVGIHGLHPHIFRHTMAHAYLVAGGSESNLMVIAGWKSRSMLSRYAASTAVERARAEHKRISPGDNYK